MEIMIDRRTWRLLIEIVVKGKWEEEKDDGKGINGFI